jgi:hypothetical protein
MTYKKKPLYKKFHHEGGFVGLPRRVFKSAEYRKLSLKARCLLDELQNRYIGSNNGQITLSNESAAERLNCSYNTVKSAYTELQKKGFIDLCLDADYTKGRAREWRLTYESYRGREPTDDWKESGYV